jgi:hypothetical protein
MLTSGALLLGARDAAACHQRWYGSGYYYYPSSGYSYAYQPSYVYRTCGYRYQPYYNYGAYGYTYQSYSGSTVQYAYQPTYVYPTTYTYQPTYTYPTYYSWQSGWRGGRGGFLCW